MCIQYVNEVIGGLMLSELASQGSTETGISTKHELYLLCAVFDIQIDLFSVWLFFLRRTLLSTNEPIRL